MPGAATLTGQLIEPTLSPASAAAFHSVGTRISSAYQFHPLRFRPSGSNEILFSIPCFTGHTPVTIVVWLGYVTVGSTPRTWLAWAPSRARRRRFGIFSLYLSACRT